MTFNPEYVKTLKKRCPLVKGECLGDKCAAFNVDSKHSYWIVVTCKPLNYRYAFRPSHFYHLFHGRDLEEAIKRYEPQIIGVTA